MRVLPSQVHKRTFELLGAEPEIMDLSEAIDRVVAGTIDAQENPFANTTTYGVHNFHKYHTASNHFYISRPIFFHRPTFDAWPEELQQEISAKLWGTHAQMEASFDNDREVLQAIAVLSDPQRYTQILTGKTDDNGSAK